MDKPIPATSPIARTVIVLLVLLCLGLAAVYFARRGADPAREGEAGSSEPAQPAFLNTAADVAYTGSQGCAACHEELLASYGESGHALSFGRVAADAESWAGSYDHPASGLAYRVYVQEGQVRVEERLALGEGDSVALADRALTYHIGSGVRVRSYLCEVDGFLVHAPLSRKAPEGAWTISPGYDTKVHPGFSRPVGAQCMHCHAGRAEAIDGSVHRFRIHEMAIGCERCHGPGALHEDLQGRPEPGTDGEDRTIANPARMSRRQKMDVCAQCHMDHLVTVPNPGRRQEDWRPGMSRNEVQVTYRMPAQIKDRGYAGHVDPLRASRCYQGSDSLTCLTCHDPHERPPHDEAERKTWFNRKCLTCHEACSRVPDEGPGVVPPEGDDCTGCHMPRDESADVHTPRTDHQIRIPGLIWAPRHEGEPPELEPLGDVSHLSEAEQSRNLGIAYLLFAGRMTFPQETRKAFLSRAQIHLLGARDEGVRDPVAEAALAQVYLGLGDRTRALRMAESAQDRDRKEHWIRPDRRADLLRFLAREAVAETQFDQAQVLLDELRTLVRSAPDALLRGEIARQSGEGDAVAAAAREALSIWPNDPDVQYMAAELFGAAGDSARRDLHNRIGVTIHKRPNVQPPK